MRRSKSGQVKSRSRGFTLIELLVVIGTIGVLIAISSTAFVVYKQTAAYAVVESTYKHARIAMEAGINDIDSPPASVPLTAQSGQGPMSNALVRDLMPGMQLPRSVKFQVSYDSTCQTAACTADTIQVNHCAGNEYLRAVRFGDGLELLTERISGSGCS